MRNNIKKILIPIVLIAIGTTALLTTLAPKSKASYSIYEPRPSIDEVFVRQYWPEPVVSKITPGLSRQQEEQALVSKNKKKTVAKAKVKQKAASSFVKVRDTSQIKEKPRVVNRGVKQAGYSLCSCVSTVRALTGANVGSVGLAKYWPKNSATPVLGGIVITNERPSTGHVAKIKAIENGYLILEEGNYKPCQFTSGRRLPINSKLIIGFWSI